MPNTPDNRGRGIPQAGKELSPVERRGQLVHDLGIGELRPAEVVSRFASLKRQIRIGLDRQGAPTRADGGVLAIRTGIPPVTHQAWEGVPAGATAYVADIAGTNWNVKKAEKQGDGSVSLADTSKKKYEDASRHVTFDEFIGRMAYPIAGDVLNEGRQDEPIDVGVSLGFPHVNRVTPEGIEADLVDVGEDGTLPKGWKITDWNSEKHSNITGALRTKLGELGVNVRTLVAINDTPAVALDGGAVQAAAQEGLDVIPAGFVGGTGTNGAVDNNGSVNLEMGHAEFPTDAVYERMRDNGWVATYPKVELETGEAINWRLAASMELLHEQDESFQFDGDLHNALKPADQNDVNAPKKDPTLIDRIASGEESTTLEMQALAGEVLQRAGQVYGMTLAAISEAASDGVTPETPRAFMVEGSTLLKAYGVKGAAEQTAAYLRQPVEIKAATGLKGVGSLAMTYPLLAA